MKSLRAPTQASCSCGYRCHNALQYLKETSGEKKDTSGHPYKEIKTFFKKETRVCYDGLAKEHELQERKPQIKVPEEETRKT